MNTGVTTNSTREQLESILLRLEQLSGMASLCATTFEQKDAFSFVSEEGTANAFSGINSQIEEVHKQVDTLLKALNSNEHKPVRTNINLNSLPISRDKDKASFETAKAFRKKYDKSGGFTFSQLMYLAEVLNSEDLFKIIDMTYDYAFRRGYKSAKRNDKEAK